MFELQLQLWLKDIASYLHLKLQNVREKDPVFTDQDEGNLFTNPLWKNVSCQLCTM